MTDEELKTYVYTGVGAASACWEGGTGAAVFREDLATEVAEHLLKVIRRHEQDVMEDIARRIRKMKPGYPQTWDGKVLVGRSMAAKVALEDSYVEDAMVEQPPNHGCGCWTCVNDRAELIADMTQRLTYRSRMIVCELCGNKRCPKATNHDLDCTLSNDPGQPGSRFA